MKYEDLSIKYIQNISIQLSEKDPSNLKIFKLLFNIFFVTVVLLVFLLSAVTINNFEKSLKYVFGLLEISCLNRRFKLVYSKLAVLSHSVLKSSKVTGFIYTSVCCDKPCFFFVEVALQRYPYEKVF